jgi:alpha-galactosidase
MIATSKSWPIDEFTASHKLYISLVISSEDMQSVKAGFVPRVMENKWFIYMEGNYLYFHRSWTGMAVYRVKFEQEGNSYIATEALMQSYEGCGSEEYNAAEIVRLIHHYLLRK